MKAALLFALPLLAACATVPPLAAGPTAGLSGTAQVDGLRVRPLSILEDSRCPAGVQCIWAGRLIVQVEVKGGNSREQLDLELGKGQPVAGGELRLVSVTPARREGPTARPGDYRFTFEFLRGR